MHQAMERSCGRRMSRLRRLSAAVGAYRQRRPERAELLGLDGRTLRDLGITRVDALREARKPFWRP